LGTSLWREGVQSKRLRSEHPQGGQESG